MKYKSCHLLEHGLYFDRNRISICCMSPNKNSSRVTLVENYYGEKINWEEIIAKKKELRASHQAGKILPSCEGCFNLEEAEWDKRDYINCIHISHWSNCNCNCVYCYYEPDKKFYNSHKPYKILPVLKDMLEKNVLTHEGYIAFSGGEPTVLDEFDDLLEFFYKMTLKTIVVNSSGIKYDETLAKGIEAGKVELTVSLDCGNAHLYKKIKSLDTFDTVIDNMKKYISMQQGTQDKVRLKYIILPEINDSVEEAEKWIQTCIEIGVKKIILDIETRWYLANRDNIPDYIYELINYVQKRAKESDLTLEYYSHVSQIVFEQNK